MKDQDDIMHEEMDLEEKDAFWKRRNVQIAAAVILLIALAAVTAFALRGDSSDPGESNTNDSAKEDRVQRRIDGVLVSEGSENKQPIAIMIENLSSVRPQVGLAEANVVYEVLAEGGITRFMAVYAGAPEADKVGPVRSARQYYVELAEEYGAIYAHAGGSPDALQNLSGNKKVHDMNAIAAGSRYFVRDNKLSAPHNLFTSNTSMVLALRDYKLEDAEPKYRAWKFEKSAKKGLEKNATSVRIPFSTAEYLVEYEYSEEQDAYLRLNGGRSHIDASTKEQIAVDTVVVQYVSSSSMGDDKGRIDVNVRGSGRAILFSGGNAVEGTWEYDDSDDRTIFSDAEGNEYTFAPGKIWVELVPDTQTVEFTAITAQADDSGTNK